MQRPIASAEVARWEGTVRAQGQDSLAVEEPCEIRLQGEAVAVVMRTPGHDHELAAGFLFTEGIITAGDIGTISRCDDPDALNPENLIEVRLAPGVQPRRGWQRNFYAASSCGICGKASIDAIHVQTAPIADDTLFDRRRLAALVGQLRQSQEVFAATGGLHAAGLFAADGSLLAVREDIGRHNAVDKVIGHALLTGRLPLQGHLLLVSGRTSFEIVQKALTASVPLLAGVSAASSLAVDLARDSGMTLVGFLRGERMVVYMGEERLR